MAAYAALVSLMNTLEQIKIHPFVSTTFDMEETEDLESRIASETYTAEDAIESHVVDQYTKKNGGLLQKIMRLVRRRPKKFHLSSVREDIGKVEKEGRSKDRTPIVASSRPIIGGFIKVGLQIDMEGTESLGETIAFLLDFIESHNGGGVSKEVEELESRIASAAHTAEDAIESHVVDILAEIDEAENGVSLLEMMRKNPKKLHLSSVICDLQKLTEDVGKVEKEGRFEDRTPIVASSSRPVSAGKTSMVGFEDYLIHLMDRLTGQPSQQQIIPIIGMGGIGKTTLARNAFDSLLIQQHFDFCGWVTISQSYKVSEILLQLLSSKFVREELVALDKGELGEKLRKYLFNRRYLIVLDDMWSIDVWNEIKFFFPDNSNGSCIVVTSRLNDLSLHFNSPRLAIDFLDEDKSWNLFYQESFGEEGCPAELEEVGKKICKNCKGLPLCIVVIGGFLRESSKSREFWEGVARDTYSILNSQEDNHCMNILSLSYNHLPAHLKPCFLYMGVFAEDEKINVSRLIQLWVAEGFLRPNDSQTLEEVANAYLKDLVGRNLILVNRWGSNGEIKMCNIHDLIRELCLSIAEKEQCLWVMKLVGSPRDINRKRRILTVHNRAIDRGLVEVDWRCFNLRFLDLPSSAFYQPIRKRICLLWNLQTVRIDENITAPSQLWEMIQLRHIKVCGLHLPDPPRNDRGDLLLPNLQTLSTALDFRLSEEVCKIIPNVKKLSLNLSLKYIWQSHLSLNYIWQAHLTLKYIWQSHLSLKYIWQSHSRRRRRDASSHYCLQNLGRFHKLESLTLKFEQRSWQPMVLNMTFPSSLKKLTLGGGRLNCEDLEMIGSLPNLEVLKFKIHAITWNTDEWNPVEGQFQRLKFLKIGVINLKTWNADGSHFPVLEKLVLVDLAQLDEIPSGIGDIPTLRIIRVYECSMPCALSAVKILEEQDDLGNEDLRVEIEFARKSGYDLMREMLEQEGGFTSKNLQLSFLRY